MPKRKKDESDLVTKVLKIKGSSERAAFELLHLGRMARSLPNTWSTFRRAVDREIPKHLLLKIHLEDNVFLPMANVKLLLQYVCENNVQFGSRLQQLAPASMMRPLQLILYIDEAQAGNVLAP